MYLPWGARSRPSVAPASSTCSGVLITPKSRQNHGPAGGKEKCAGHARQAQPPAPVTPCLARGTPAQDKDAPDARRFAAAASGSGELGVSVWRSSDWGDPPEGMPGSRHSPRGSAALRSAGDSRPHSHSDATTAPVSRTHTSKRFLCKFQRMPLTAEEG